MGTINALRTSGSQLHSLSDAAENLRLGQQHGGVFESVTLSDDARPTARTGLGERMRGALDSVDVRGAFSSIGSRLSQAASTVSDAVGRAAHGFMRAAGSASEAIASKLGIRTSTAVMKTAYATVQSEQGNYVHGQAHTYLRGPELSESNAAMRASCKTAFQSQLDAFAEQVGEGGLAVSSQVAIDDALVRAGPSDADTATTRAASAQRFLGNAEALCDLLFGDGSDEQLRAKADQFSQSFCDLAAARRQGITDLANRPATEKAAMGKLLAGQDLSLRTFSPLLYDMYMRMDAGSEKRANLTDLTKFLQNVATDKRNPKETLEPGVAADYARLVGEGHDRMMRLDALIVARGAAGAQAALNR